MKGPLQPVNGKRSIKYGLRGWARLRVCWMKQVHLNGSVSRRYDNLSCLSIRLLVRFTLVLTQIDSLEWPLIRSLPLCLLPGFDRYCRSHTAHRLVFSGHPFFWCIPANAWRNRPHVRYPIIKHRDRSWAKSSNLHRWSPQECSHASHSTSVWWYPSRLRRRCSR